MAGVFDTPKATDEARKEVAENRSTVSRYVQKTKAAWNKRCPFQSLKFSE
jgi:predicted transcriptional regulator YheO